MDFRHVGREEVARGPALRRGYSTDGRLRSLTTAPVLEPIIVPRSTVNSPLWEDGRDNDCMAVGYSKLDLI